MIPEELGEMGRWLPYDYILAYKQLFVCCSLWSFVTLLYIVGGTSRLNVFIVLHRFVLSLVAALLV